MYTLGTAFLRHCMDVMGVCVCVCVCVCERYMLKIWYLLQIFNKRIVKTNQGNNMITY